MVALAILAVFLSGVLMAMTAGSRAMQTGAIVTTVESSAREALEEICGHIETAALSSTSVIGIEAPASTSTLEYRRVLGYAGGAAILSNPERVEFQYSPTDPDDGLDNDGNGLVDEGRVVWTEDLGMASERSVVICSQVQEFQEGEIPGNGVDDNGNGLTDEAGLCFSNDGRRIIVRLTVAKAAPSLGLMARGAVQKVIVVRVSGD